MYGMIHRGIRQMVLDEGGPAAWAEIESSLGTGPEQLISAQTYDDAITVDMLGRTAESLGLSLGECLQAFGRYWVRFAERGSFGAMMDFTGADLPTFIENLDRMHQAVRAAMPEAQVPSFRVAEKADGFLRVEYLSDREGLDTFVTGLFEGLLDRFGHQGTVEQVPPGGNAPEFVIRYSPA